MDSDKEEYLPASQLIEPEKEKEQETENSQEAGQDAAQAGKNTRQKTKTKEKSKAKDPCIYCGENCVKGTVQCAVCALWCHMKCTGLSKEALRGLEIQAKEVGQAYWACRACMNFSNKWNKQMREVTRKQEETDAKVASNSDKIEEVRRITEEQYQELRRYLNEQAKRTEGIQERVEKALDDELRERDARRLNLVIHGLQEPDGNIKDPKARMEQDRIECEKLFIAMKARTRYQVVRFCRRIGERGEDPRPLVFGVYTEEEKRHLLEKAKELLYTCYENVTIVPDMTKSQRRGEQRLREEADQRNRQLTEEDRSKNLKWLVVGKRGEKRLIKGMEREGQWGRQERERGTGWNPQIRVNTGPNRPSDRQHQQWGQENRRTSIQNWRPGNGYSDRSDSNGGGGGFGNRGNSNNNWRPEPSIGNGGGGGGGFGNRGSSNSNNWRPEPSSGNGGGGSAGGGGFENRGNSNNNSNWRSEQSSGYPGNNTNGGGNGGGRFFTNNSGPSNSTVSYGGPNSHDMVGTNNSNICNNSGNGNIGHSNTSDNAADSGGAFNVGVATAATGTGGGGGPTTGGLRPTELGARIRDGGVWAQHPENNFSRETDRQASQQAGWHAVEGRNLGPPPLLLPRPPIQRGPDQTATDPRTRLGSNSNKRQRSHDRDMEEEEQLAARNRRY